jgi:MFS transporter, DHA1 family, quinolone resistance protein
MVGAPLAVLAAIAFIAQIGIAVMLPLLPLYATQLGASPFVLGLLTSAFAVTNGLAQLSAGFFLDRFGSRRFISGGLGLYAAANALIATATNAVSLVAFRALSGVGGGVLIVAERVYVAEVTPAERRAFANGILSAATSAGLVAGPVVGGVVAHVLGLQGVFLLVAATSFLALIASLFLPRPVRTDAQTAAREAADRASTRLPLGPLGVLVLVNSALFAGYGGFITTYAPLATVRLGWTPLDVGIAFSMFGAGSILLGPALSHLADRTGRRRVAVLATIPVALFGVALVLAWPRLVIYAVSVIAGGGLTAFSASWFALLADVSPERVRGRIFGVVNGISSIGIIIGAMLAAALWERVSLSAGMLSSSAAMLLAGAALLAFRPPPGPETPSSDELGVAADASGDAHP